MPLNGWQTNLLFRAMWRPVVQREEIEDMLWPSGSISISDDPLRVLHIRLVEFRKKLRPFGLDLVSCGHARGWRLVIHERAH